MAAKVTLNSGGMAELLRSAGVAAALEEHGARVLAAAKAAAPVDSGAYRDSLHLETEQHSDRVAVHVVAGVDYAAVVEANTSTLARALGAR